MGADSERAKALRVPLVAPPLLLPLLLLTASPVAAPSAIANNASLSEAVGVADQTFQWVLAYLLRTQQ